MSNSTLHLLAVAQAMHLEPDPLGSNHGCAIALLGDLGLGFLVCAMRMTTVATYAGCCEMK